MFFIILFWCLMPVFLASAADESSLKIEKIGSGSECLIVATNKSAAPMTVTVGITTKAMGRRSQSAKKWFLKGVVSPISTSELGRFPTENEQACRDAYIVAFHNIGDAFAVPDKQYKYRLPFKKGLVVRVTQEPNGVLTTHRDALTRYAVDFAVPKDTPVLAARAGTVIGVIDRFEKGRPDPKLAETTNLVSVIHSDGTFAQYAHLARNGVLVRPGEQVEAGQIIGYSGNTGFSGGPHLHFDVRQARIQANGAVMQVSLPFNFYRQQSGEKITLRQRMRLTVD
ncbi:MAG: M23 family metallopeptidase [Azoarcus sp.]|nr:M23 family metallopeptidase [Azoarcus sp.]